MRGARRTRELAFLLPLGGLLLLMPPYIAIFDRPAFLVGFPLLPTYIFAVWTVLIVLAFLLSRRLSRPTGAPPDNGA